MDVQKNILNLDFLDVLFENRNKSYGAYDLRKVYPKHIKRSAVIIFLFLFVVVGGYMVYKFVDPSKLFPKPEKIVDVTTLQAPPPMDEKAPPPPPPPPPPPVKPTIRFVPPKIEKDELVQEEEKIVEQEDLKPDIKISTETKEGDKDAEEVVNTDLEEKGGGVVENNNEVFTYVEIEPIFPGGEEGFVKFLQNNIKYPPFALENDISGKVYVEFTLDENGAASDVKVVKDIGGGCGKEAERVLKMMPRWTPARNNGRAVKYRFSVPVSFEPN